MLIKAKRCDVNQVKNTTSNHQLIFQELFDVCETEVNLDNLFESEGILTDSLESKSIIENEIIHNSECTGFLI